MYGLAVGVYHIEWETAVTMVYSTWLYAYSYVCEMVHTVYFNHSIHGACVCQRPTIVWSEIHD